MNRKTVVTIELERVRVITKKPRGQVIFCEFCGTTNEFVASTEAIELARLIGINNLKTFHFFQTTEHKILVCLNSIFENC